MYVGHGLVGFALAGALARWRGLDTEQVLLVATLGAGYGLLPDVDLVYTVYAVAESGPTGIFPTTEHVWTESWVIHRTLTHSSLVGALLVCIVAGTGLTQAGDDEPAVPAALRVSGGVAAGTLTAGLLWIAIVADGPLGASTMALLIVGAAGLAVAGRRCSLPVGWLVCAASAGVLLHPLGDLWMGRPPRVLYPIAPALSFPSIRFAADPTINFIAAFAIELGLVWASLLVWLSTTGRRVSAMLRPTAVIGVAAVAAIVLVPPPTFVLAYQFSAGVVGLGVLSAFGTGWLEQSSGQQHLRLGQSAPQSIEGAAVVTGFATITLGLASYLLAYLVV